jgi:hypothetical protein
MVESAVHLNENDVFFAIFVVGDAINKLDKLKFLRNLGNI